MTSKRTATNTDRDGWHLAGAPLETAVTQLEFSLERTLHAFYRWKEACMTAVADLGLSGNDVAALNVLRMQETAKSRQQLATLLNRDDTSNLQYALRKLLRAGLIEKVDATSRKNTTYGVTDAGRKLTDAYASLRRTLLTASPGLALPATDDLERAAAALDSLAIAYGTAQRLAEAHAAAQDAENRAA